MFKSFVFFAAVLAPSIFALPEPQTSVVRDGQYANYTLSYGTDKIISSKAIFDSRGEWKEDSNVELYDIKYTDSFSDTDISFDGSSFTANWKIEDTNQLVSIYFLAKTTDGSDFAQDVELSITGKYKECDECDAYIALPRSIKS